MGHLCNYASLYLTLGRVCVVDGWLKQPHLAQVWARLIRLWLAEAAHLWCIG